METSEVLDGSLASPSFSGNLVASITDGKLYIWAVQAPDLKEQISVRSQPKDIIAIRWCQEQDDSHLLVVSRQLIESIFLYDHHHRMRISNGSGGLGQFQSAHYVTSSSVLVIWEFGTTKVYDGAGKVGFSTDMKTQSGARAWALNTKRGKNVSPLAVLSQVNAQDQLNFHAPTLGPALPSVPLTTTDAQTLSWSPDGNWLAVLDVAHARPNLVILTQTGHRYRDYHPAAECTDDDLGLTLKTVTWSSDSRMLAVSRYDSSVILLNTRTFSPLALIEHSTTIEQQGIAPYDRAIIWQENVSATNVRSYARVAQPVSPPLSRGKPSTEPTELGVAEARFSCDSRFLATRDERMLSTVWIWDLNTLCAHAVIIQHKNVRRIHWHPSRSNLLMLDCGESIAYLYDATTNSAPEPSRISGMPAIPILSFVPSMQAEDKPTILAATKSAFRFLYPEGRKVMVRTAMLGPTVYDADEYDAGPGKKILYENGTYDDRPDNDDSFLDMLSGKTPARSAVKSRYIKSVDMGDEAEGVTIELQTYGRPGKDIGTPSEASYTDLEGLSDEETEGLDDTFRQKRRKRIESAAHSPDPLDDSEIF